MAISPQLDLSYESEVFLEKNRQHSSDFALAQETRSLVKRCPKCQSVFVTDEECESCGLQLQLDRLQAPLGERSYFGIKERAVENSKIFGFYLPWLASIQKGPFLSECFYRFRALVEELCLSEDDFREVETRRLYLLELGLIVEELTFHSEDEKKTLEEMLILLEGPKTQTLSQLIQRKYEKTLEIKRSRASKGFFHKRYFGLIQMVSIVRITALVGLILLCSIALYRYLTLVA